MDPAVSSIDVALGLLGGLALFLFGMARFSEPLRDLAGDQTRRLLERFTGSIFGGIVTGTIATAILGSSSVLIILTIALVNAGLLRFEHSLGVVMGANIGTTMTSQLFALDVERYAPIGLMVGLLLSWTARGGTVKLVGRALADFSLVFFGLGLMGQAAAPLQQDARFLGWMHEAEHPLRGAAAGAVVTGIIQSSSATLGIVIQMAAQQLISLKAGIALMMGAEIGTCADTLLATLGRSRAAVRTGVFHLAFNVLSVSLGLLLFPAFTRLVVWLPGTGVAHQVANAHVLFNLLGVVVFAWFIGPAAALLRRVIPDRAGGEALDAADAALLAGADPEITA